MVGQLHRLVTAPEAGPKAVAGAGDEGATTTTLGAVAPAATQFDSALVSRLRELQRLSAERNLRLTGRLLRLLEQLRRTGVEAMPYKGPALAERLYGDVTLRSWMDLDLIVRHDQATLAREALLDAGFHDCNPFNIQIMRRKRGGWGEVTFFSADEGLYVDLHWEVGVGVSTHSLTAEALFARSQPQRLLGQEVPGFSAGDLLIASCLHGTRDRWCYVEALLGLAVQVRDMSAASWQEIMAVARGVGCARRVGIAVVHLCGLFGLEVPPEVAGAMEGDRVARALLRSLKPDSLNLDLPASPRRELAGHYWIFATEDSTPAGVWHGLVRVFAPDPVIGRVTPCRRGPNGCTTLYARRVWPSSGQGAYSRLAGDDRRRGRSRLSTERGDLLLSGSAPAQRALLPPSRRHDRRAGRDPLDPGPRLTRGLSAG